MYLRRPEKVLVYWAFALWVRKTNGPTRCQRFSLIQGLLAASGQSDGDPGVKQRNEQTVGDVHVSTNTPDIVATLVKQHLDPHSVKLTISESQMRNFCKLLANDAFFNFCVLSCRTFSGTSTLLCPLWEPIDPLRSVICLSTEAPVIAAALGGGDGWPHATHICSSARSGTSRLFSSAMRRRECDLSNYLRFFFSFILTYSYVRYCREQHSSAEITSSNGKPHLCLLHLCCGILLTEPAQWAQLHAKRDEISFNWSHFFFFFFNWQLCEWTLDGIVAVQEPCKLQQHTGFFFFPSNKSFTKLQNNVMWRENK